jgi:hypothetical protein
MIDKKRRGKKQNSSNMLGLKMRGWMDGKNRKKKKAIADVNA